VARVLLVRGEALSYQDVRHSLNALSSQPPSPGDLGNRQRLLLHCSQDFPPGGRLTGGLGQLVPRRFELQWSPTDEFFDPSESKYRIMANELLDGEWRWAFGRCTEERLD
jgi:hypothetical protein